MPRIVITHAVADLERWKQGKAERAAAVGSVGSNVTDHVALDGSNNVAVTADIHDMGALQSMITAPPPDLVALMEKHGVVQPFTTYIEA